VKLAIGTGNEGGTTLIPPTELCPGEGTSSGLFFPFLLGISLAFAFQTLFVTLRDTPVPFEFLLLPPLEPEPLSSRRVTLCAATFFFLFLGGFPAFTLMATWDKTLLSHLRLCQHEVAAALEFFAILFISFSPPCCQFMGRRFRIAAAKTSLTSEYPRGRVRAPR
jgi:hypothetical protein